ncbi:TIGR00341 family protein [Halobacteriales archaeon QS_3_64_16]|nr:MAG: TIGR00341 family protein [Halobacteriales archaeon QS_3_64_16]
MGATRLQTDETPPRDATVLYVPVPQGGAEPVLDELYDIGLSKESHAVIADGDVAADADLSLSDLDDQYVEGPDEGPGIDNSSLRERAEDLTPDRRTYVAFAALSAVVAVAGLLLSSATVVLVALLGATGVSLLARSTSFVPPSLAITRLDQVASFITPSLLALAIAIAASAVGALALATDLPTAITGIAVAAAIVLLVMNVVTINLTTYVGLVALGYRSSIIAGAREQFTLSARTGAYVLAIVVFVLALALATFGTYQYLTFQQSVNSEVQTTLDSDTYETLELMGVSTSYTGDVFNVGGQSTVTVTVGRTAEVEYPLLANLLRDRISSAANRPVTVQVRFVDYEQAQASRSTRSMPAGFSTEPAADRPAPPGIATT